TLIIKTKQSVKQIQELQQICDSSSQRILQLENILQEQTNRKDYRLRSGSNIAAENTQGQQHQQQQQQTRPMSKVTYSNRPGPRPFSSTER
ncbi:unnamed protein product, partial [Schistosoma turkestanicum]